MNPIDDLAKTLEYLAIRQLRDFGAPLHETEEGSGTIFESRLDSTFATMSDLLRIALLSRGARDMPIIEKTLWEVEFTYKSVPFTLMHTKFGVKLQSQIAGGPEVPVTSLSEELVDRLRSAVRNMRERVVEPQIVQQRRVNNVEIVNQHSRYQGLVLYFRKKLEGAIDGAELSEPEPFRIEVSPSLGGGDLVHDLENVLSGVHRDIERAHEIAYLATALLAGYFSMIQHRLILLTGFSPRVLDDDFSVDELLERSKWAEQFDAAMKGRGAEDDKVARSDLSYLAKTYRNSLLHGGGGRLSDGIIVEWAPGYRSIVTERGEFTDQFMLWQPAVTSHEARDILVRIDRIESWFNSLPYFPWIERGLPVSFEGRAVATALRHLRDGTVAMHIAQEEFRYDQAVNFEW
ncbi:hypothetical protein [Nocardia nova]|uniref:Uncharacterized protein n=1 Tax=Nocardia nova TaxID=37330 RepID=A0A2S5ZVD9_9NOCA|nr:hypothetical protein [Nocardia nova]PPJ19896.1 hypothetical protein C5F51_34515 [Nocardia nova]